MNAPLLGVIPFTPPPHFDLPGPFALSAHGVAFLAAAVTTLILVRRRAPKMYHKAIEDVVPYMLLGAVIGARGLYFVQQPHLWRQPWRFFTFWEGGLVSYGGMAGALVAFALFMRFRGLPVARLADALAPTALIGWGVGRIGCFLSWNGEWGKFSELPWAFSVDGVARHPVMLYLSVCLAVAGVVLLRADTSRPFWVTGWSFFWYGTIRAVIDEWRDYDPPVLVWTSRAACVVIACFGLFLLYRFRNSKQPSPPTEVLQKEPLDPVL